MSPMWRPSDVESPTLIAELAEKYTSGARAFVVYRNGTVVYSDTSAHRPDEDYIATLLAAVRERPGFTVREMNDGNFLIRFEGPVAGIVVADFYNERIDRIHESVETEALFPGEQVMSNADFNVPAEHYYIGLYARAKLLADAEDLEICRRAFEADPAD